MSGYCCTYVKFLHAHTHTHTHTHTHHIHTNRNTIDRTALSKTKPNFSRLGYDSPKSNPILASKFDDDVYIDPDEQIYTDPAEDIYAEPPEGDDDIYAIPPELSDEEEQEQHYKAPRPLLTAYKMNGDAHIGSARKAGSEERERNSREASVESEGSSAPRRPGDVGKPNAHASFNGSGEVTGAAPTKVKTTAVSTSSNSSACSAPRKGSLIEDSGVTTSVGSQSTTNGASKPKHSIYDDTVFDTDLPKEAAASDMPPSDRDATADKDDAVYENTNFDVENSSIVKKAPAPAPAKKTSLLKKAPLANMPSQSSVRHKPRRHTPDEYEDLENFEGKSPTELIPALDDYVDMEGSEHNTYVPTEEFQRRGSDFSEPSATSPKNELNPVSPAANAIPEPQGK